jgi:hypothetical protein
MQRTRLVMLLMLLATALAPAQWERAPKPQNLFDVKWIDVNGIQVGVGVIDYTTQTNGSIWQSNDTGTTWTRRLSTTSVESYLQSGAHLSAATTFSGILFSSDSGATWQPATVADGAAPYSMMLSHGGVWYCGVNSSYPVANSVLRSTDFGVTWSPAGTGFGGERVVALAGFDSIMLAGTFHLSTPATSGGIFRSTDGGATWTKTALNSVSASTFASNGTFLFAGTDKGVYRSADDGLTWTIVNSGFPTASVSGLVADGATVYAGTKGKGVFNSIDNGDHWLALNDGLTDQNVRTLASNGYVLFAGTSGGLWKLTVKTPVSPPRDLLAQAELNAVVLQWHGTGDFKSLKYIVYQGTSPAPTTPVDTVISTTGNNFERTISGLTAGATYFFRVAAMDSVGRLSEYSNEVSATPFALGCIAGTVSAPVGGLKGVTVKLLDTLASPLSDATTDQNGQYLFPALPGGTYEVMIVEPVGYSTTSNPVRVSVAPPDTVRADFVLVQTVLTSKARSAWYWKHQFDVATTGKGTAQESTEALLRYIENISRCYTVYFPMYQSATTLADWRTILSPTLWSPFRKWAECELGALLLNVASVKLGQYAVATTDGRTVGEVALHVSNMILDADSTNELLAAFLAWECNLNILIGSGIIPKADIMLGVGDDQAGDVPRQTQLMENFPNPFNPATEIRYTVAASNASVISLKVYDLLGREVATLVNAQKAPGAYTVAWNASGLASGMYLCRLQSGSFVQTKRMLLLK